MEETRGHDDGRTGHLEHFGIKVIRFTNEEILGNEELVIRQIRKYLDELAVPRSPGSGGRKGVRSSTVGSDG